MGTIPAQDFLHRLTASAQKRRFKWALSELNRGDQSQYNGNSGSGRTAGSDESGDNDDSFQHGFQVEDGNISAKIIAAGAHMLGQAVSEPYPIKDVTGTPQREWLSFHFGREETPKPLTGIFIAPQLLTLGKENSLDDERDSPDGGVKIEISGATYNKTEKKVRFDDVPQSIAVETSPEQLDYASAIPPNIRIRLSAVPILDEMDSEGEEEELHELEDYESSDEAEDGEYDTYDVLPSTDSSEGHPEVDHPRRPKPSIVDILRRMKGHCHEASMSSSSGAEIEYGGVRLKEYSSDIDLDDDDDNSELQAALWPIIESTEEEDENSSQSIPQDDNRSSIQIPSENEERDDSDEVGQVETYADAMMQHIGVARPHSPSASSVSLSQKIPDLEAYRHIPLLDYHGIALAEDAAARCLLQVRPKIGRLSMGMNPPKQNLSKLRVLFGEHVDKLDEEELNTYTMSQRRTAFEKFCNVGQISVVSLHSAKDAIRYLEHIDEDDDVNRDLHEIVRQELGNSHKDDLKEFMRVINEEDRRLGELHKQKTYFERAQEAAAAAAERGIDAEEALDELRKKWETGWPRTPGWEPVKAGWRSDDGRIICVEEGIIPRFEFVEELVFGPPLPQIVWSGAKVSDDLHINHDLAFKVLHTESKWRETPTGMYLKRIDDDEVASIASNDSDNSASSSDSDITWSSRLLNHRLMLTCNSVHGSNVDLTFDPEELDTPTLDGERHFAKIRCGGLRYRYPNYVRTIRMFNQMAELVVIPPPKRKEWLPRKTCLKHSTLWWSLRRSRPKKVRKKVSFKLNNEQTVRSQDAYMPRINGFNRKKNKLFREELANDGIFELLPSVRAGHTRLHGYNKYYQEILPLPEDTHMTTTASRPKAYLYNHLARFKLGLPKSYNSKLGQQVGNVIRDVLQHRDRAAADRMTAPSMLYEYKMYTGGRRRRRRMVKPPDEEIAKIDRTGIQYLLYAKLGKKVTPDELEWEDIDDEDNQ
ncbi:hypothetical protein Dda_8372 [Drechslerella dactyloides]|uniref:Uncharacterized protein n=1 Tax=Drechslerella dactyloides TaxID=74499 RepID=A0AAD6NFM4_DREDA|nr:hypothetical protein Dda_8372 [Drechslerella dactyloides]